VARLITESIFLSGVAVTLAAVMQKLSRLTSDVIMNWVAPELPWHELGDTQHVIRELRGE